MSADPTVRQFMVTLPRTLHAALQAAARRDRRPMRDIVAALVELYCASEETQRVVADLLKAQEEA